MTEDDLEALRNDHEAMAILKEMDGRSGRITLTELFDNPPPGLDRDELNSRIETLKKKGLILQRGEGWNGSLGLTAEGRRFLHG